MCSYINIKEEIQDLLTAGRSQTSFLGVVQNLKSR